jgi:DNA-binding transcriptional LysR family regulator
MVSRAIALLEGHLGTRLIDRTTREVSLTRLGARYLEGCRAFLEDLDQLDAMLTQTEDKPKDTLRVLASSILSHPTLTDLVSGFHSLYPNMEVRLTITDRDSDFDEKAYDVGIVAGPFDHPDITRRTVGVEAFVPVATPAFLTEHGVPTAPVDLRSLPSVCVQDDIRGQTWTFRHESGVAEDVTLAPVLSVSDGNLARLATLNTIGFSVLPSGLVLPDVEDGALVRLLQAYSVNESGMEVSIVYPARAHLPRKTRLFADYSETHFCRVTLGR